MEKIRTILFGGILLLSGLCYVNSDSESDDLLDEILASLENEAQEDVSGTSSTTTTEDPLKTAFVTSQMDFSKTSKNNQTSENGKDSYSIDQVSIRDNETSSSLSLGEWSDNGLDKAIENLTTTLASKYSSSSYDVTALPGSSTPFVTEYPTEEICSSSNILQSLCREDLPSLVKIANIWDIYNVLFSDEVINELLLNCASGEWCIRDEFDIFRAKMSEKADMVLHSAVFGDTCTEVSLVCLEKVVHQFQPCSFGEVRESQR